jgi:hypothetical protein
MNRESTAALLLLRQEKEEGRMRPEFKGARSGLNA